MTKNPFPTPLVFTQNKEATHPRIGLGLRSQLTPSKTASPLVFFRLHWLEHGRCPCFSRHLLAKSHRYILSENVTNFLDNISVKALGLSTIMRGCKLFKLSVTRARQEYDNILSLWPYWSFFQCKGISEENLLRFQSRDFSNKGQRKVERPF